VTTGNSTRVLSNVCVDGVSEIGIGARVFDLRVAEAVSVTEWSDGGCGVALESDIAPCSDAW